jgi:hypothetical protein
MTGTEKTSISLPTDLIAWARRKGNASKYIAELIERDKRRERTRDMFVAHGYVGELAITDEGIKAAGERLAAIEARRTAKQRQHEQQQAA